MSGPNIAQQRVRYKHIPVDNEVLASRIEASELFRQAVEAGQCQYYTGKNPTLTLITMVTICEVIEYCDAAREGVVVATGYAFCSQQYNRRLGNTIARGRAMKALLREAPGA